MNKTSRSQRVKVYQKTIVFRYGTNIFFFLLSIPDFNNNSKFDESLPIFQPDKSDNVKSALDPTDF